MSYFTEMPTTFNYKPLEKVLFEDEPGTIARSIDRAMHMLIHVDQNYFQKNDIITCYEDLRNLRNAIQEGGKSCQ